MKLLVIDCDETRLKSIFNSVSKVGKVGREVIPITSLQTVQVECGLFDLILLHVGQEQNDDGDLDTSMEIFANKPVLCFGAGVPYSLVRQKTKNRDSLWCLCPEQMQIVRGITPEEFINSHAGKGICRYIQRIEEGKSPVDAKNELQGFSVKLEKVLEKLYEDLRNGESAENIIKERDDYFNSDEYLNSEMTSQ